MIRNVIFICLIAIVLTFVVQNTQVVEFRFLVWTIYSGLMGSGKK